MVMFGATNDDDNEKAAKKAIKEKVFPPPWRCT